MIRESNLSWQLVHCPSAWFELDERAIAQAFMGSNPISRINKKQKGIHSQKPCIPFSDGSAAPIHPSYKQVVQPIIKLFLDYINPSIVKLIQLKSVSYVCAVVAERPNVPAL